MGEGVEGERGRKGKGKCICIYILIRSGWLLDYVDGVEKRKRNDIMGYLGGHELLRIIP